MTDIGALCSKLYDRIEWQRLPSSVSCVDKNDLLIKAIVSGIEDLFVVTGRAASYPQYEYIYENGVVSEFTYDLRLDEELYVLCGAQKYFFSKIRAQYTDILGYTTNALTVTNADKPYAYMTSTIKELEDRMRIYFYKMVQYSHLE